MSLLVFIFVIYIYLNLWIWLSEQVLQSWTHRELYCKVFYSRFMTASGSSQPTLTTPVLIAARGPFSWPREESGWPCPWIYIDQLFHLFTFISQYLPSESSTLPIFFILSFMWILLIRDWNNFVLSEVSFLKKNLNQD